MEDSKITSEKGDEYYRLMMEKITDVFFSLDLDLNIIYVNSSIEDLVGYTPEEFIQFSIEKILTPESYHNVVKALSEAISLDERGIFDEAPDIEVEMIRKDGSLIWVELSRTFLRDAEEKPTGILGIARDITKRKEVESALQASERLFAESQRIAQLGTWDWNIETGEDIWSDECYRIFGLDPDTFIPDFESFIQRVHPDDRESVRKASEVSQKTGARYRVAHRIIKDDGEVRFVQEDAEVLLDSEGKPYRMIGTMLDITDLKAAEESAKDARARAEFFNDLMAHDLTNIHQGLMVSLELIICADDLPPSLKGFAQNALTQVEKSVALIRSVRKFTSIHSEEHPYSTTDIFSSFYSAKEAISYSFPMKRITITSNISEGKFLVFANEFLFDIWYNLFHNAAKFDLDNSVIIDVIADDYPDDDNFFLFRVEDRGPGIASDRKEAVLYRLERTATSSSGIGLTLVKQILQNLGGTIWIEDRIENDHSKGSSICFLLRKDKKNI